MDCEIHEFTCKSFRFMLVYFFLRMSSDAAVTTCMHAHMLREKTWLLAPTNEEEQ